MKDKAILRGVAPDMQALVLEMEELASRVYQLGQSIDAAQSVARLPSPEETGSQITDLTAMMAVALNSIQDAAESLDIAARLAAMGQWFYESDLPQDRSAIH